MSKLKSITISNFRSIRGQITVELDAPIVLIHGQNGAGKTSILSAIELGLTGKVQSLGRNEKEYMSHLLHKTAESGLINLSVVDGKNSAPASVEITKNGFKSSQFLDEGLSRFFTERCYLAQSTLGRLLEIYQNQKTDKSDSPLTKFVKDLLGLDRLEALIDGLHPTGHLSRLKITAPAFSNAKTDIEKLTLELAKYQDEENTQRKHLNDVLIQIRANLEITEPDKDIINISPLILKDKFDLDVSEDKLIAISKLRRDLDTIYKKWSSLAESNQSEQRAILERNELEARDALQKWRIQFGNRLNDLHEELKAFSPDLPNPESDPDLARNVASRVVKNEIERCKNLIRNDANDRNSLIQINSNLAQGRARIAALESQMIHSTNLTSQLVEGIAFVGAHILDDECPICGRDFSEVSDQSLSAHVSHRISELSIEAARLRTIANDKAQTSGLLTKLESDSIEISNRILPSNVRDELKTRLARFEEIYLALEELTLATNDAKELQINAAESIRRLIEFRNSDEESNSLRMAVNEIAEKLNQPQLQNSEALDLALVRLIDFSKLQETEVAKIQSLRRGTIELVGAWIRADQRLQNISEPIEKLKAQLSSLRLAKKESDRRLDLAKDIARNAKETRTQIVRRVFNEELNKLWKELFIRLAPEEPFVPAFSVPDPTSNSNVEAKLETIYKNGVKGGNPQAMLSAGNLNTAALTLFLSLHLSVKPQLPWLIIDDPVQSMDEVHIAQFAALLRTLAKQNDRQIIIAVHEKPLFDYLALELSPAFPEDRLITIELGKDSQGNTTVLYEPRIFAVDQAIAA